MKITRKKNKQTHLRFLKTSYFTTNRITENGKHQLDSNRNFKYVSVPEKYQIDTRVKRFFDKNYR